MAIGSVAFVLGVMDLVWLWAPVMGLGIGMVFAGTTTLPALLARTRDDAAGFTALTLTVGYAFAFFGPLIGGVLLDYTHVVTSPFWVIAASAALAVLLGATLSKSISAGPYPIAAAKP
jgi:cyanate permease